MVIGTGPEGQEVVEAPGELVAAVGVDGLEKASDNPHVHGQDVEILGNGTVENGGANSAKTKDKDLNGRRILGGKAERSRVVVVNFVDILVQEGKDVHGAVGPVVPGILEDEENGNLVGHLQRRRERNASFETKELGHGVEEPDLGKLDGKVAQQHQGGALPLLLSGGNLGLAAR